MKLEALAPAAVKSTEKTETQVRVSRTGITTMAGLAVASGIKAGIYLELNQQQSIYMDGQEV